MDELRMKLGDIDRHHTVSADYAKTLALLRALKAGKVTLDNVVMTDNGWQLIEITGASEVPADPAS